VRAVERHARELQPSQVSDVMTMMAMMNMMAMMTMMAIMTPLTCSRTQPSPRFAPHATATPDLG
jgi:hypothetical protein